MSSTRIVGKLVREATIGMWPAGRAKPHRTLTVRIRQEQGLPYIAVMPVGNSAAEILAAERKARAMSVGQVVTVIGEWLDLTTTTDGAPALRVNNVSEITPQIARHHAETTT